MEKEPKKTYSKYHHSPKPRWWKKGKQFKKGLIPWNKGKKGLQPNPMKGIFVSKTYSALHARTRILRGRPTTCEHCGRTGLKGGFIQWASLTKNYEDINDYIRLCGKCHYKFDGKHKKKPGFLDKNGKFKIPKRNCLDCGKSFKPRNSAHKYCGSFYEKTGCSHKRFNEYHRLRYHQLNQLK